MGLGLRFIAPIVLVLALAPVARADGASAADIESARAAFAEGLDLRDKQHDLPAAVARFRAAYALVPTARIGWELGKTLRAEGDLVGARAAFVAVQNLPPRRHESAEAQKARADADAQAAELEQRIPALAIHVSGAGEVSVDGERVRPDALTVPRRLNPGRHVVELHVQGMVAKRRTVTLREGERRDLTLSVSVVVTPSVESPAPPRADVFATPVTNRVHSNAGTKAAFFYAASTLAGLGVPTGIVALSSMKNAQGNCASGACTDEFANNKNLALGFAVATDALWGTALICLVVAIAYPSTSPLPSTEVGVAPVPGGGVFVTGGRF